ncbi:MAG: hypothetical protein H8D67_21135 [Deltaproteobacteria bacterium]|nr:hypothetical protein [Deltaproteobacteria bacterium]
MKKIIVLLAVLLLPGIALAESTNIFPAPNKDHLWIVTTTDNGDVRTSNAHRVSDTGWVIFDDRGGSRMVNDFSNDGRGDREDRD